MLSTANHYVLDVLAGAATLCLAFALQSAFDRLRARAPVRGGRRVAVAAASASAALDPVALGLTQAADYAAPPPLAEPPRSPGRFAHPLRASSAQEGASELGEHAAGGVGEPATP